MEEINNQKKVDKSVIIGIIIIVVLIIIFAVVRAAENNKNTDSEMNTEETQEMNSEDLMDGSDGELSNNIMSESDIVSSQKMIINIPVLAGDIFDTPGVKKRGCDTVVFVEREVDQNPAILNATISEMFSFDQDLGFLPGNFVASQGSLNFERATIENGLASIYLTGEIGPIAGTCDNPRLQIQLEEAALQFATVNSVQIYLNGEPYQAPTEQ